MSESAGVYVALRVAERPEPMVPSRRMTCCDCGQPVWVDPVAYAPMKLHDPDLRVLCGRCVKEAVA